MINFHAPRRWPPLIFLALLLAGVGGCLSLRLEEVGPAALLAGLPHDFASGKLSTQAQENLRTEKLDELWHRSPEAACRELSTRMLAEENQSPDKRVSHLLTLAEMYHHLAKGSTPGVTLHPDRWQDLQALFYARCAAYSAHAMAGLLREPEDQSSRMVGSLRTVDLAMDMHNNACLELTRLARNRGKLVPGGTLTLKGPSATRPSENGSLEIVDVGIPLPLQEFGKLTPAGELRVVGLDCKHDRPGLGVPLLAHLRPVADGSKSIYLDGLKVPVSAHLVIPARLAEVPDWTRLELRLVDPHRLETVDIAGQAVPLAADFTTPLAASLVDSGLEKLSEKAFFKGDLADKKRGLFLLEPYRAGKIPVVLVHGLLSSPVTWAMLVNDLRADPVLRDKYQFWTFFYPSSQPIVVSASELRSSLRATRDMLDANHEDLAMDRMVLVGHSMGGLLSRLQAVDSGEAVWREFSHANFDSLKLSATTREMVRGIFFFKKIPEVSRVVFLATPHAGSPIGNTFLGQLGATFASTPSGLRKLCLEVLRDNPKAFDLEASATNSVMALRPGSPGLRAIKACGPPRVPFHTIAGALEEKSSLISLEHWLHDLPPGIRTDGVVELESARLAGAVSELVYPAEHTRVHQDNPGVSEVRRILLEHLDAPSDPKPDPPAPTAPGN